MLSGDHHGDGDITLPIGNHGARSTTIIITDIIQTGTLNITDITVTGTSHVTPDIILSITPA